MKSKEKEQTSPLDGKLNVRKINTEIIGLKLEISKLLSKNTELWSEIGGLRTEIVKLNTIIMNIENNKDRKYILTIEDEIYGQETFFPRL